MLLNTVLLCCSIFSVLAYPVQNETQAIVKPGPEYFLPDEKISPISYKVTIDVSKSFEKGRPSTFTGEVEILALVNEDINEIILHAADITIKRDFNTIMIHDIETVIVDLYRTHVFDAEKQFLKIDIYGPVKKGKTIRINIKHYEGILQNDMHGFYVSQYTQGNNKDPQYVLTTQFQPTHARKAFPCFDEPKYKATFELTFKKPKGYQVISNNPAVEENNGEADEEVHFPATPRMSTYLVAFIVHKFAKSSTENSKYNVWSRPEAKRQTKWATDYMYKIVKNLDEFTGIKYEKSLPKMDMAALPDFSAGAMENWGLLTYRETALLVDENLSTNKDIQRVVSVISHEVAHQWFGNLVTLSWWKNTWLNEGFARYFEYHTTGNILPEWEMKDQFVVEQHQNVFGVDALAKSTPLTLNVYTPSEISSHFGSISYGKGGSVIRMMEHFLGSNIFQAGLRNYLRKNELGNTEPEDLFSAVQSIMDTEKAPVDFSLKSIMSSWTTQAGYPVINVKSDEKGSFDFSQERFLINPEENKAKPDQKWFVPISYTTSNALNFENMKPKFWLTPQDSTRTIKEDADFLIVNIQESGYYRVNYDEDLWKKITKALLDEKSIHHLNKAQIIDDVLNLARAGKVDYKIAFDITDYLAKETNYYPWYSAFQAFRFLLQRYSDADDTGVEVRKYVKKLMEHLVEDKDFSGKETKQIEVFNTVAALDWACNLGNEDCTSKATDLYKDFKEKQKSIPKNLKAIVYCTGIRYGNNDDWEFLWKRFKESNVAAEKISIINALGCSSEEKTLKKFLDFSIDATSGIRKQDAYYVFSAVFTGGNSKGVDVAFAFLKDNYKKIIENYNGMNDLEKAVLGVGARLTDSKKIEEFKKLLDSSNDFANFKEAAIETVTQNIAWSEKYNTVIKDIMLGKNFAAGLIANKFVIILLGFISIRNYIFS